MKPFSVPVKQGYSVIYYHVQLHSNDGSFEVWHVWRENEYCKLQSNRPLLRGKGLKYKLPDWKKLECNIAYANVIADIINGIMKKLHGDQ